MFEEKLTPGGTEVKLWRTEQISEESRVKITENMTEEEIKKLNLDTSSLPRDVFFVDKKSAGDKQTDQSNVSWMAKNYNSFVGAESAVQGKEVVSQTQKQTQLEHLSGDLEATRHIATTDTLEQQHKSVTKEVKVSGPVEETQPPVFTTKIEPVLVKHGNKVTYTCTFTGIPIPKITWYRENFVLQNSKEIEVYSISNGTSASLDLSVT